MLKIHSRAEERRKTIILDNAKLMEIICYTANVCQSNITGSIVHVEVYSLYFYIFQKKPCYLTVIYFSYDDIFIVKD